MRTGQAKGFNLRYEANYNFRETDMNDLILTVAVTAFFVIGGLYVRFCEKL